MQPSYCLVLRDYGMAFWFLHTYVRTLSLLPVEGDDSSGVAGRFGEPGHSKHTKLHIPLCAKLQVCVCARESIFKYGIRYIYCT